MRRAIVLLPRRVLALPPAVQRAVIAHELVHVRRRDWLHTIAEEFWCAVFWFHPAARIIALRLSLARETVVDEITIRATRDRRAYAEALLAFSNPQPHLPAVTPLIGRHSLSQRIALIAEEEVMSRRRMLAQCRNCVHPVSRRDHVGGHRVSHHDAPRKPVRSTGRARATA